MIRKATREDIPSITSLMKFEPGFWHDSWPNDTLERALANANGLAFVWEESGELLGFACAHDLGFRAYLNEIIVHKAARRKGIGKALLWAIENDLQVRGCNVIIADVWREAIGFYKSQGWSEPDVTLLRKKLPKRDNQQPTSPDRQ